MRMDQERLIEQLFPLDDKPGPARITSSRARAIIENALDIWQHERTKALRRNRGKTVLLAAAIVALASGAAGLFHAWTVSKQQQSSANTQPPRATQRETSIATSEPQVEPGLRIPASNHGALRSINARKTHKQAEDLLRKANRRRQQGRWREAEQTYRSVSLIYPKSPSAYVALIAAASIRLEQLDDARGALRLYNRAVKIDPSGSLDIEARMGIARAWQRLGKRAREIESLRRILRKHDSGPMVRQAKQRLEVISRGD